MKPKKSISRRYYEANKERIKQRYREFYQTHKEQERARRKKYYQSHKAETKRVVLAYKQEHNEALAQWSYQWRLDLKRQVLEHYGNGELACVHCGYSDIRALSLDHINGKGLQHRKENHIGGTIYRWLKKQNYPVGFQTLCMNCQFIKRVNQQEYRVKRSLP